MNQLGQEIARGQSVSSAQRGRLTSEDRVQARLIAMVPLFVTVVLYLGPLHFWGPPDPPLLLPGLVWGFVGVLFTWRARSWLGVAFAILAFTIPGSLAMLVVPPIVLILQNLR